MEIYREAFPLKKLWLHEVTLVGKFSCPQLRGWDRCVDVMSAQGPLNALDAAFVLIGSMV